MPASKRSSKSSSKPRTRSTTTRSQKKRQVTGRGSVITPINNWLHSHFRTVGWCRKNAKNAQECFNSIKQVYPELIVCKPFGNSDLDVDHLPDVHHAFDRNVGGLILNDKNSHIVGVKDTKDNVSVVAPPIPLRKPVRSPVLNVSNIPVIQPVTQTDKQHLLNQVAESNQVISKNLHKDLTSEAKSNQPITSDVDSDSEIPFAPPMFDGPFLIHTEDHGTVPLMVHKPDELKTPKNRSKDVVVTENDELLNAIRGKNFQLKKTDYSTNKSYDAVHQTDFLKQLKNGKSSLKPVQINEVVDHPLDHSTNQAFSLQNMLNKRRESMEPIRDSSVAEGDSDWE